MVVLSDIEIFRRDRRVISLIGVSHAASHFYQLALPPLYPLMHAGEGYSYASLGALTGAFFVASAVFQPISGFFVDRFGSRTILLIGLACLACATGLMAVFPYYPILFCLSIVAGIGNSVFHPCDYSIMNATISEGRIARAFSYHMFGGYVGYVAAPVSMSILGVIVGWKFSIGLAGLIGLLLFVVLLRLCY